MLWFFWCGAGLRMESAHYVMMSLLVCGISEGPHSGFTIA